MAGPNDLLTKTFKAGAVLAKNTIVKFGSNDDEVLNAVIAADLAVGVTLEAAAAIGDRIEVQMVGIAEVKAAGTIARGAYVVATAGGEGVAITIGGITIKSPVGQAAASAVAGDVFPVRLGPYEAITAIV